MNAEYTETVNNPLYEGAIVNRERYSSFWCGYKINHNKCLVYSALTAMFVIALTGGSYINYMTWPKALNSTRIEPKAVAGLTTIMFVFMVVFVLVGGFCIRRALNKKDEEANALMADE